MQRAVETIQSNAGTSIFVLFAPPRASLIRAVPKGMGTEQKISYVAHCTKVPSCGGEIEVMGTAAHVATLTL